LFSTNSLNRLIAMAPEHLSPLPIDEVLPHVLEALRNTPNLVLQAPPGAGKTTRLPPALLSTNWLQYPHNRVVLLQPRRVAARACAARIAQEQGWTLGKEVGYHIRFERCFQKDTRLLVVTEGILARQLQSDPFLEGVGCVILDEFHERNLHSELALSLLREVQEALRPDLRLVVMSATLEADPVVEFLGGATKLISPGRLHPVEVEYESVESTAPIFDRTASAIHRLLKQESAGHILAFLPGMQEIRRTQEAVGNPSGTETHVLHSSVGTEEQDRALAPSTKRKVILSTNIAETSITIEGVRAVVDSGLEKVLVNESRLGIDRLETQRISLASAEQRAGRAGRTGPGRCIRLWTRGQNTTLAPMRQPEIHRIDLAGTVLALKTFGVGKLEDFRWFDAPPPQQIQRAVELLMLLGGLDSQEMLTEHGKQLAALPLHPRLANLLLDSQKAGILQHGATVAAMLSENTFPGRERGGGASSESDVIDALEEYVRDSGAYTRLRRLQEELVGLFQTLGKKKSVPVSEAKEALMKALLKAFPDRLCIRRVQDSQRAVMVGGRGVSLGRDCTVRRAPLFLGLDPTDVMGGGKGEARVSLASAVELPWLKEECPHLVSERVECVFDEEKQSLRAFRRLYFLEQVVQESPTSLESSTNSAEVLFSALQSRVEELVRGEESAASMISRCRLMATNYPTDDWPRFDQKEMMEVLKMACIEARTTSDVKSNLCAALQQTLGWNRVKELESLTPEKLPVPSGSAITLTYDWEGSAAPILAVRLQEMFGLPETPTLLDGRVRVLLHLLGPNYRPVQVTQDLASFWKNTYPEVRKELRGRYPKHSWPDNPLEAIAVRGVKRRTPNP
jgi:ATP-dependent helicase HrpB